MILGASFRTPDLRISREMINGLTALESRYNIIRVKKISVIEVKVRMFDPSVNITEVTGAEIIENMHRFTPLHEKIHEAAADETGSPCNQTHHISM